MRSSIVRVGAATLLTVIVIQIKKKRDRNPP
jgi:hypothetical protein